MIELIVVGRYRADETSTLSLGSCWRKTCSLCSQHAATVYWHSTRPRTRWDQKTVQSTDAGSWTGHS